MKAVQIDTGWVSGVLSDAGTVEAFLGVPFAQPPVGPLRWRPPQPATPWQGVRVCDRYGPACPQPPMAADSLMRQFSFQEPPECGLSEDCLYLNVWRPVERAEPLPVVVFVYGGGHRVGSGSHPVSRGGPMAREGAVVVTFNYRVGAFGYLAHPALTAEAGWSGNYAAWDVLAVLQWVQRNIAALGGSPENVTLFGQSAGAALASVLMASPLADGLFHKAILHSGGRFPNSPPGPLAAKSLADAEQVGVGLVANTPARTIDEMRELPVEAVLALEAPRGFWGPVIDGFLWREPLQTTFERGGQLNIPLLLGYTGDEGSPYPVEAIRDRASLLRFATDSYGAAAEQVVALYAHETDEQAQQAGYSLRRDAQFAMQIWTCARLHTLAQKGPVYLFNFEHVPSLPSGAVFHEKKPPMGYGAYHGCELWYVFGSLDFAPWPVDAPDRDLSRLMSAAWVAFARDGKPQAPGLPVWAPVGNQVQAMVFGPGARLTAPRNLKALETLAAWAQG